MLNVIMLNVIMLNVIMLNVIMLNVIMCRCSSTWKVPRSGRLWPYSQTYHQTGGLAIYKHASLLGPFVSYKDNKVF